MTRHDGGPGGGRPPVGPRRDAAAARPSRPVRPPGARVPPEDLGGPGSGTLGAGAETRGSVEPGDLTTPFYPLQRGREEPRPSAAPVPASAHAPGTAVLPARGVGDPPDDRTAPLPRTGEESLGTWAPPVPTRRRGATPPVGPGHTRGEVADVEDAPVTGGAVPGGAVPGGAADTDAGPAEAPSGPDPVEDPVAAAGWQLVRAAQQGDTAAFGTLFDRYHDVVFRFVLYRLGDRPLAEDLTQETFVRAYRRLDSVSYQGRDIGAWFVTIARNLVLDHVKSSRHRLESPIGEVTEIVADRASPGPEGEVVAGLVHAELLRCVDRLRTDQRECIDLRFLQGLSVSETAVAMDRNEGAVKALQHRAVKRLGQLMPEGLR